MGSKKKKSSGVYGEFIRTFTFGDLISQQNRQLSLPIVQPGGSLVFPIATVAPHGVQYINEDSRVGLLVPRGTYLVTWNLNPSEGASVELLVNGQRPRTVETNFPYGRVTASVGDISKSYLIEAPLKKDNLISLVNNGETLLTLSDIPNTRVGLTSVLTQIRVTSL